MPAAISPAAAFGDHLSDYFSRFAEALEHALPPAAQDPPRLHQAMRYACEGGKRLRALLVYGAGVTLGADPARLDAPACAVELIHAYSLVHDDLPAMDDDDLRRGRPTVHKAYDEATAILVGDALQALAFEVIAAAEGLEAGQRAQMLALLARAAGSLGMVGGQVVDIESEGQSLALERLQSLHARKTGALIRAGLQLGGVAAGADATVMAALERFGELLGLAFQIQDDVLDLTANTQTLGKTAGKDLAQQKSTFPALLGLDGAKQRAAALFDQACAAVQGLPAQGAPLAWLAGHIQQRAY